MTAAPYFPWATILAFAVIALLLSRFAHKQAHQQRNQMQVVYFQDHFNDVSMECYRQIKTLSAAALEQLDIRTEASRDINGVMETIRFPRFPGRMHQENYEMTYQDGRLVHIRSRYGQDLEVCSGKLVDMLSVVMKLHVILRDHRAKHLSGQVRMKEISPT